MSDYNFYGVNTPVAINTGACTLTDPETIAAGNPLGNSGDVIYLKISDTQGVVIVAVSYTHLTLPTILLV